MNRTIIFVALLACFGPAFAEMDQFQAAQRVRNAGFKCEIIRSFAGTDDTQHILMCDQGRRYTLKQVGGQWKLTDMNAAQEGHPATPAADASCSGPAIEPMLAAQYPQYCSRFVNYGRDLIRNAGLKCDKVSVVWASKIMLAVACDASKKLVIYEINQIPTPTVHEASIEQIEWDYRMKIGDQAPY